MKPELKRLNASRKVLTRGAAPKRPLLSTSVRNDCARFLNDLIFSEDIIQCIYKNISGKIFNLLLRHTFSGQSDTQVKSGNVCPMKPHNLPYVGSCSHSPKVVFSKINTK